MSNVSRLMRSLFARINSMMPGMSTGSGKWEWLLVLIIHFTDESIYIRCFMALIFLQIYAKFFFHTQKTTPPAGAGGVVYSKVSQVAPTTAGGGSLPWLFPFPA
jgi:hypothetical protein